MTKRRAAHLSADLLVRKGEAIPHDFDQPKPALEIAAARAEAVFPTPDIVVNADEPVEIREVKIGKYVTAAVIVGGLLGGVLLAMVMNAGTRENVADLDPAFRTAPVAAPAEIAPATPVADEEPPLAPVEIVRTEPVAPPAQETSAAAESTEFSEPAVTLRPSQAADPVPAKVALGEDTGALDKVAATPTVDKGPLPPFEPVAPTPEKQSLAVAETSETLPSGAGGPVVEALPARPVADAGIRIQLLSVRSEARALEAWETVHTRHASVLGDRAPIIERADLGTKGVYYRLQTGPFGSMSDARNACRTLEGAGQGCLVVRPTKG